MTITLEEKYARLIEPIEHKKLTHLLIRKLYGMLFVTGKTKDPKVKKQLWDLYEEIDPGFTSDELLLHIYIDGIPSVGSMVLVTTNKNS